MQDDTDDDADVPPSLRQMFIQSADCLRDTDSITKSLHRQQNTSKMWNDKPPMLQGPRGKPETPNLLKGVSERDNLSAASRVES